MLGNCPECDRLWRGYAEAIRVALKITSHRQIAAIEQNSAACATLEPLYQAAMTSRELARKAITDHGFTHRTRTGKSAVETLHFLSRNALD